MHTKVSFAVDARRIDAPSLQRMRKRSPNLDVRPNLARFCGSASATVQAKGLKAKCNGRVAAWYESGAVCTACTKTTTPEEEDWDDGCGRHSTTCELVPSAKKAHRLEITPRRLANCRKIEFTLFQHGLRGSSIQPSDFVLKVPTSSTTFAPGSIAGGHSLLCVARARSRGP
jgi:hypothetical protein